MRRAVLAALLLSATSAAAADDDRAFVELTAPRDTYYVGEPVRLRLRFGVDAEFFRTSAVQLFQRPLDVPVQIQAPWIRDLPATQLWGEPSTFALNDGTAEAWSENAVRGGRTFTVCAIERTFAPERPGDVTFAAPTLRFAYATQFDESDLRGRVAVDRHDAAVAGKPLTLHVLALPDAGRPPAFAGAVGHFTIRADTNVEREGFGEAVVGQTFKLTLHIHGEGNLETLIAPRLDDLDGFHVFGAIDDHGRPERTIVYDIAATRADLRGIPAIEFAFFDTAPPAQYRVAETSPIPIDVRPSSQERRTGTAPSDEPGGSHATAVVVVAIVTAIVAALLFARRRRPAQDGRTASPIRAAADALRADVAAGDPEAAFVRFLGACLAVPDAAVVAPDLAARLASAGVPGAVARHAASLLDGLVAARYGGGPPGADARAAVLAAAADVAAALDPPRAPAPRS